MGLPGWIILILSMAFACWMIVAQAKEARQGRDWQKRYDVRQAEVDAAWEKFRGRARSNPDDR